MVNKNDKKDVFVVKLLFWGRSEWHVMKIDEGISQS